MFVRPLKNVGSIRVCNISADFLKTSTCELVLIYVSTACKASALKATCVCSCSFMLESYQIFTATDMTNDTKNWQILQNSDTEFTGWQHSLISLQNRCSTIQRSSLHLTWCLETPSIPGGSFWVSLSLSKNLDMKTKHHSYGMKLEQSFSLFQFHSSLF